ncbi:MAG: DUF4235 domain-containing protein [Bacteroidota bacterium]
MKNRLSRKKNKPEVKEELKVLVVHGATMLGSYLLKRIAEEIIEKGFKRKVPVNPWEDEDISWGEAIGWAAFIGATSGVMKLFIKRGTRIGIEKAL